MKETVLITGGSGLIGQHLSSLLINSGYKVSCLSRSKRQFSGVKSYLWDIKKAYIDEQALLSADYIIHLAGAGIADKRWSKERKKQIIASRVESTRLLFAKLKSLQHSLKAFISASAVGYYGALTSNKVYNESHPAGGDFLGKTCLLWEEAINQFNTLDIRTVILRTAMVLSNRGGALAKLALPAKFGLASGMGSGKQFVPWIHIEDLCRAYLWAIENKEAKGVYNAIAPHHITNNEFMRCLAQSLNRPFFMPNIPALFLKMLVGEMSLLFLEGSRISAEKILKQGFRYHYTDLKEALNSLFKK